ncbi:MAG: hypothetical protein ILP12_04645 [Lachnospiraceae bacterium]|nr:hypothetical protein [Lachnospiraceae bacterium]
MKTIKTDGIGFLEPLEGSGGWYFGTDYTSGDLYEAEELYRDGHRISKNRLIFVHKKQGRVREPVKAREGQYFGRPVYDSGRIVILLADFPAGEVRLLAFAPGSRKQLQTLAALPLAEIPDCYNLMPHTAPLTLTRQASDNTFQILWPERISFAIGPRETFCFRKGDRLFFSRWHEDPDYREEVIVRDLKGRVLRESPGSTLTLDDGTVWLLR